MGRKIGLLRLLLLCFIFTLANAQFLFHGTSIVIYPNATSRWPSDSTVVASNFYCYFNLNGYLSFGWWLPASPGTNTSHCTPRPSSYDWYEYTTTWNCSEGKCRAYAINFSTSNETKPYFEEEYVLSTTDVGNGKLGKFGLSYFDREGGGYAVGTKRILSDAAEGLQSVQDCEKAFKTLQEIKREKALSLSFDMVDICPSVGDHQTQKAMQAGLK
ncbi:hypothetical protein N7G274_007595 [Stereocaulon virgatum]|uniref:Uncharacterized protein n=1 Tax=Stereocaulon virgatum TaxID=373712 RepID=A0ABR4A447_9LECA